MRAYGWGEAAFINPITGMAGCCARATSGHVAAAPVKSPINSRRCMSDPTLKRRYLSGSNEYFVALKSDYQTNVVAQRQCPLRVKNGPKAANVCRPLFPPQ